MTCFVTFGGGTSRDCERERRNSFVPVMKRENGWSVTSSCTRSGDDGGCSVEFDGISFHGFEESLKARFTLNVVKCNGPRILFG